jgi:hypothetical protein
MIQRIQTVFLLLVVISGALAFYFPIAAYFSETVYSKFFLSGVTELAREPFATEAVKNQFSVWFTLPLLIIQVVAILLAGYTIFQYKRRPFQIKMNRLTIFLNVMLVGAVFFYSTMIEERVAAKPDYGLAVIFPLISIILLFLANRYTRKDEKLIRSADRLR